jgi:predicted alpha-1,2-mannosidase
VLPRALGPLSLLLSLVGAAPGCGDDATGALPPVDDPLPWIDPTIGTGGVGFAYGASFVGATVPHGLVKLGPDTNGPYGTVGFQHFSGYHAEDDRLQGFSHLHLHGAGLVDYGVLSVMPTRAFDPAKLGVADYQARYAKEAEVARPGAYQLTIAAGVDGPAEDITALLVATAHGAHHRYDFGGASGTLIVDLFKTLAGGVIDDAELHLDASAGTGWGRLHHLGDMSGNFGGYDLYFALRARTPWTSHQLWADGAATSASDGAGVQVGAALTFAAAPDGAPVELQVAVSLVDRAGAEANLVAELPGWDLEATRAAAEAAWRAVTGTILVDGGSAAQRRIFYTSLYHAFLMPSVVGDVDGRYRIAGEATPRTGTHRHMTDLSLWDTYRTVHPLYALVAPASAADAARSLLAFGAATGTFPRWPIATGESGTMLGAPAEIVLGDAIARDVDPGLLDDVAVAWPMLRAAALDETAPKTGRGTRTDVEPYMTYGYMPSDLVGRSVSTTTEFAHADLALATIADALGEVDDASTLRTRREGWRALFDDRVGFLRARDSAGQFEPTTDFDPTDDLPEYAEANAWQSMWMAGIHDPDGLAALFGGRAAAVAKLEELFTLTAEDWDPTDPQAGLSPQPYYWHGNEPDLNAAWLFAQLGRPDLTQTWVRWIADNLYNDGPTGVAGNDDGGTLGSWLVWASLGLYPIAGTDEFVVSAPMFPRLRLQLGGGHALEIEAAGAPDLTYVAGVSVDGVALDAPALTQRALLAAERIEVTLADAPTAWGQR